ncbi:MAG: PqqD family protein [Acidobacteria bacterium]|nr:PqqD family protein [Acidobacteriota bacterium]
MDHQKTNGQPVRARQEELVVQDLPDEVLVYDLRNHKAHCLNQTAAFVWHHCDGDRTTAEIADLMTKEWGKPVTEDVVWLALKQLSKADLLQVRIAKTSDGMRASRREVIRKLGLAAAMTPLVVSIVAPTALAGPSVPPVCTACVKKSETACPTACAGLIGRCYGNAGCGAGNVGGCTTCDDCFALADPRSWVIPGSPACP